MHLSLNARVTSLEVFKPEKLPEIINLEVIFINNTKSWGEAGRGCTEARTENLKWKFHAGRLQKKN